MGKEIFQKEVDALEQARSALEQARGLEKGVEQAFRTLVSRYAKLVRQSGLMVTMGDRMQNSLNQLNNELAASESKYRGVFENVTEGIYRCAPDGRLIEINPSMAAMFGFDGVRSFLVDVVNIKELFCTLDDYERYESLLMTDGVQRQEVQACGPDGRTIWVEISASLIKGEEDEPGTIVGVLADVTERKKMLEDMCRLARTDSLTGLWNRGYFMELSLREVTRSLRNGSDLSLLILDVDYFKSVNDTYGHDVGDQALISIANTVRDSVREVDIVGRYGGEEFVVLLPDAAAGAAAAVADRITGNVRSRVFDCGNVKLSITASIGLTSFEQGDDLDSLLKYADIALYAAKKKGRDRSEIYRRETGDCVTCPTSRKREHTVGERQ